MRLSLELDPALLARAEAEAAREQTTLDRLLARLIAHGLATGIGVNPPTPPPPTVPFRWAVTYGGQPRLGGIDWTSNVSIYEATEMEYDLRQAGVLPFDDPDDAGAAGA